MTSTRLELALPVMLALPGVSSSFSLADGVACIIILEDGFKMPVEAKQEANLKLPPSPSPSPSP
jgi:hypothetical protein